MRPATQHRRPHRPAILRLAAALLCLLTPSVPAADWPQFRGPNRDGVSAETIDPAAWPAGGPRQLWKARLGRSSSAVSVVAGRLYTMGFAADLGEGGKPLKADDAKSVGQDTVWCLDAATGALLWKHAYPARCDEGLGGTFCTPTVAAGRVYTLSRDGQVHCLDAQTGRVVWTLNLVKDFGAPIPDYGFSCSPLVTAGVLVIHCGGKRAATLGLDPQTGQTLWRWGAGDIHYASPVPFDHAGKPGVVLTTPTRTVGLSATDGRELWRYGDKALRGETSCATPVVVGQKLFVHGTWDGRPAALLELNPLAPAAGPKVLWANRELLNFVQSAVVVDGHVYGSHSTNKGGAAARFKCLNLGTGAVAWEQAGFGQAPVIAAGDTLLITGEKGDLVLARASPDGFKELARAQPLPGHTSVHPVLCDGRLYCRNNAGDLVCLDVKGR